MILLIQRWKQRLRDVQGLAQGHSDKVVEQALGPMLGFSVEQRPHLNREAITALRLLIVFQLADSPALGILASAGKAALALVQLYLSHLTFPTRNDLPKQDRDLAPPAAHVVIFCPPPHFLLCSMSSGALNHIIQKDQSVRCF